SPCATLFPYTTLFRSSDHALIVPKTSDGRVLFAVPWLGKVILGTTDTPRQTIQTEPLALKAELDFILKESIAHLQKAPSPSDIRSEEHTSELQSRENL